jgi:hypothetical protein
MNVIIENVNKLPIELVKLIGEYVPKKEFVFTNRENYNLYHPLIKSSIKNYENYIRDMIRRDNEFVFEKIFQENYKTWFTIKQYIYKNMVFKNYFYFTISFCIENESNNCRNIINPFMKEHGLCKNLHKKNVVKYIRWKN